MCWRTCVVSPVESSGINPAIADSRPFVDWNQPVVFVQVDEIAVASVECLAEIKPTLKHWHDILHVGIKFREPPHVPPLSKIDKATA